MPELTTFQSMRPRALKPGDTLGIVAPASPFDRHAFDAGIKVLESIGFRVSIPDEIFEKQDYLAGSDQGRADLLNRLFADPGIHGIICARGGYGTMRLLTLLDADVISSNPKVFVGFSDITVLLSFLNECCGMVAFHGPTVTTLGNGNHMTREHFFSAVTRPEPPILEATRHHVIHAGSATGRFCCGNLTLLCHLTGTPFQPDYSGCILLIEDRGEAPYRIDRMLTHMKMAGCFDGLAGLALGSFADCGPDQAVRRIVADCLGEMNIPILAGFDVGHEAVNLTLPVGLSVRMDTGGRTLLFTEPALC